MPLSKMSSLDLILNEARTVKPGEIVEPLDIRPPEATPLGVVTGESARRLYEVARRYYLQADALLAAVENEKSASRQHQILYHQHRLLDLGEIAFELFWFEAYDELHLFGVIPEGFNACVFQGFEVGYVSDQQMEADLWEKRLLALDPTSSRLQ